MCPVVFFKKTKVHIQLALTRTSFFEIWLPFHMTHKFSAVRNISAKKRLFVHGSIKFTLLRHVVFATMVLIKSNPVVCFRYCAESDSYRCQLYRGLLNATICYTGDPVPPMAEQLPDVGLFPKCITSEKRDSRWRKEHTHLSAVITTADVNADER